MKRVLIFWAWSLALACQSGGAALFAGGKNWGGHAPGPPPHLPTQHVRLHALISAAKG